MHEKEKERIRKVSRQLADAEKPVRVLRSVSWSQNVKTRFFAKNASELPRVSYPEFDCAPTLEAVHDARKHLHPDSNIDRFLIDVADSVEQGAALLASLGTRDFLRHSIDLYGAPDSSLPDESSNSLDLARRFDEILDTLCHVDLGAPPQADYHADSVAEKIDEAVKKFFGDAAPQVVVVDELSANALAGPRRILLRRGAAFTDRDAAQLINHEAFVHVATSLNGRLQTDLPVLASSHAGTAKTQEGLAVFAEFITGNIELDRVRRLADRVIAIQMSIDGADFLEVYQYFLERTDNPDQSFESARRVFRGGVMTGGAPFTKDIVYLDGLLRVHNFLRSAVAAGRADCLRLLFCGKLDLEHIPALCELRAAGMCRSPRFLPPWARDLRFLLSYLAYSGFLDNVKLDRIVAHFQDLFRAAPIVAVRDQSA